jgi:hypothetical protein
MKIENETKIRQIREALGQAIGVAADAVSVQHRAPYVPPAPAPPAPGAAAE